MKATKSDRCHLCWSSNVIGSVYCGRAFRRRYSSQEQSLPAELGADHDLIVD